MTLTWFEISQRWPECCVPWDRDVAPKLTWEPRFRDRDGVLWADCEADHRFRDRSSEYFAGMPLTFSVCRCRVWDGDTWISHAEHKRRSSLELLNDDLKAGRVRVTEPWSRHRWTVIDEAQNVSNDALVHALSNWVNPTTYQRFVDRLRDPPRQRLRGTRAQRKRQRAALSAARAPGTGR